MESQSQTPDSILDAGLLVVCLHGLGDDAALVGGEGAGDLVGDRGVRPLLPQLLDCILGVLSRSVWQIYCCIDREYLGTLTRFYDTNNSDIDFGLSMNDSPLKVSIIFSLCFARKNM